MTPDLPNRGSRSETSAHPILLYDGVCGLCNWTVQFILRRDGAGVFRFAALQGELAKRILARHGADAGALAAVVVVVDFDEAVERSCCPGRTRQFYPAAAGSGLGRAAPGFGE